MTGAELLKATFLNTQLVYVYENGPSVVPNLEAARKYGLNCVTLAHLCIAQLFDYTLPRTLLCTEMFFDRKHLEKVPPETSQVGDLVWLGRKSSTPPEDFVPVYKDGVLSNWREFPVNHVGVVVDAIEPDNLKILHASQFAGTVVISSQRELALTPRYAVPHGISRLREEYVGTPTASIA